MAAPVALTVAGSDPTGGAGVQADLQVFASLGVHGAAVISAVTVQDTQRVYATHAVPSQVVADQLASVLDDMLVAAMKTGMLASAPTVEAVAAILHSRPRVPLVIDPVLRSSSGAELLDASGVEAMLELLLPRASLVTPNLAEAEALAGHAVTTPQEMAAAGQYLLSLGVGAALVKGGHLAGEPVDVLVTAEGPQQLVGRRVAGGTAVHGTGCALSAAIAALLARGEDPPTAVAQAKRYITAALESARAVGRGARILDYARGAAALPE